MVLTLWMGQLASTFTLRWCSAGTRRVERRFRRYWRPAAYPLAHPYVTENRPSGLSLGRLPSRALAGYVATVPMLRTASGCEDGSIYPSLFAAVRNVMASW